MIEHPRAFEGKTVKVEGVVTAVCSEMGCWMALAPDAAAAKADTLLIKIEEGVIIFPVSTKGRRAAAQGMIERVGGGHDHEAAAEHAAPEGRPADGAGSWQLKTTGAMVY